MTEKPQTPEPTLGERKDYLQLAYRRQAELHRGLAHVEMLWEVGRQDATVRFHLDAWRSGRIATFEHMLVALVTQLAREKHENMKTATVDFDATAAHWTDEIFTKKNPDASGKLQKLKSHIARKLLYYEGKQAEIDDPDGDGKELYADLENMVFELTQIQYGLKWLDDERTDWPFVQNKEPIPEQADGSRSVTRDFCRRLGGKYNGDHGSGEEYQFSVGCDPRVLTVLIHDEDGVLVNINDLTSGVDVTLSTDPNRAQFASLLKLIFPAWPEGD